MHLFKKKNLLPLAALCSVLFMAGCGGFGKVNQGRTIQYDPDTGLVTLIQDSNYQEPGNPRYDVLPPVTVRIPDDRKQMGPPPEAGKLMLLDSGNKRVVIFDASGKQFKTIAYTLIEQDNNVYMDDSRVAGKSFPIVDREKLTITVYSPRRRQLVTFSLPDEYFTLPDDTWKAGDEIRYYYKDPGQALRLMNVTKTEVR